MVLRFGAEVTEMSKGTYKRKKKRNRNKSINIRNEKGSFWSRLFKAVTIIAYILTIVLFIGAFTGKRELVTNTMPLLLIGKRRSTLIWVYPFDFFYFWTIPWAVITIIRKMKNFWQPFALAGVFLVPVFLHKTIDEYGPWYSDQSMDITVFCVIFAVFVGIGTAYCYISDALGKGKKRFREQINKKHFD